MNRHLIYGIAQRYLPPHTGECFILTPARRAGIWFNYPTVMEFHLGSLVTKKTMTAAQK